MLQTFFVTGSVILDSVFGFSWNLESFNGFVAKKHYLSFVSLYVSKGRQGWGKVALNRIALNRY